MAFPKPPDASTAPRRSPGLLEIGALCLDSDIIFGFTSHLLRRKAKVRAPRPGRGGGGGWGDGKLPAERSWRLCGLSAPRTVRAAPRSGAEKRGGTAPVQPENVSDGAFCGRHSGTRNTRNFVAAPGSGARVSQSCAGGERGRPSPRGAGTQWYFLEGGSSDTWSGKFKR